MTTVITDLSSARDSLVDSADKMDRIVNGPVSGADSIVSTGGGNVKTAARSMSEAAAIPGRAFALKSDLTAATGTEDSESATVWNDPTDVNNGVYRWNAGTSAWVRLSANPNQRLDALEGENADSRLDTLEALDAGTRLTSAETSITSHGTRLTNVESADTALDGRLDTIEALNAGTRLTSAESAIMSHGTRLTAAESADTALDGRVDTLEGLNAATRLSELEAIDAGARLTSAETSITALEAMSDAVFAEPAVSELASMWSTAVIGEPSDRAAIAGGDFVLTGQSGQVIRVTGAATRAPRAVYRLLPSHKYEVLAAARRNTNPTDPLGDAVSLRASWLNGSKTQIGLVSLEDHNLTSGEGLHLFRVVVALAAGDEVDVVAAAGTVYVTPFVQTYGGNGVTDIVPYIRVTDLTSNTLVSADVSGLTTRMTALESLSSGSRLTALEAVTATPKTAWHGTVSDAEAATIGVSVDRIIVLGNPGDETVFAVYSRAGSGDFQSADGQWWSLDHSLEAVIAKDTTFTIAPTGGDFTEPGAFTDFMASRRIAPGVTVTVNIASGTYACTKHVRGHIDGRQIVYTNSGLNGPALDGYSATITGISGDGTHVTVTFNGTHTFQTGGTIYLRKNAPSGYNGNHVVTSATSSTVTFASAVTDAATVLGTVNGDFGSLDDIWVFASLAITTDSLAAAKTAAEAIVRAKFKVIFEFSTIVEDAAFTCDGLHSGQWKTAPCLWINTGTTIDRGITTGSNDPNNSDGAGGVAAFRNQYVFGFRNACCETDQDGLINMGGGGALFGGKINLQSNFGGGFNGDNGTAGMVLIGGLQYGYRANHVGFAYLPHVFIRGCGIGIEVTNSMLAWADFCDIQFCGAGVSGNGGQVRVAVGKVKNNAFYQVAVTTGNVDASSIDMQSTELFEAAQPPLGINAPVSGTVNASTTPTFQHTVVTGHQKDLYVDGTGIIQTTPSTGTYGQAYTNGSVHVSPDPFTGYLQGTVSGRPQNGTVEMSGTALTLPSPCPYVVSVVQPSGSAGSAITVSSMDFSSMAAGDEVTIVAANAAAGETVLFNEFSGVALSAPARFLANIRDVLTLIRPTGSTQLCELSYQPTNDNGFIQVTAARTLNAGESGKTFYVSGATGRTDITLPTAAASIVYTIHCGDTDGVRIIASSGDKVWLGSTASATAGRLDSTTLGSVITIRAVNTTDWYSENYTGSWTVT